MIIAVALVKSPTQLILYFYASSDSVSQYHTMAAPPVTRQVRRNAISYAD